VTDISAWPWAWKVVLAGLISLVAAVWVFWDALQSYRQQDGLRILWASAWAIATLSLLGLALPCYLIFRPRRRAVAPEQAPAPVASLLDLVAVLILALTVALVLSGYVAFFFTRKEWLAAAVGLLGQSAILLGFSWIVVESIHRRRMTEIGWTGQRWAKSLALGIGAAIFIYGVGIGLETLIVKGLGLLFDPLRIALMVEEEHLRLPEFLPSLPFRASYLFSWAVVVLVAPVGEEVFFRGLAYTAIREKWGVAAGLIVSSLGFAVVHMYLIHFLPVLITGLVLAYLRERTGSLVAPMVAHLATNGALLAFWYKLPQLYT